VDDDDDEEEEEEEEKKYCPKTNSYINIVMYQGWCD
jgi:hypothetical protein